MMIKKNRESVSISKSNAEVIYSPAKVNLRLKVTGRRSDGYHLLSMLNVQVALFDRIIASFDDTGQISIADDSVVETAEREVLLNPEKNVASRALKAFFDYYNLPYGANLKFIKQIPTGAGFAGGSSNAGTLLRWAAERLKAQITGTHKINCREYYNNLAGIAVKYSADAPFFIQGKISLLFGIGEEIFCLKHSNLSGKDILLAIPDIKSFTPNVFNIYRKDVPDGQLMPDKELPEAGELEKLSYREYLRLVSNDLTKVIDQVDPEIIRIIKKFSSLGDVCVEMTGAGSAIYILADNDQGVFPEIVEEKARELAAEMKVALIKSKII